MKIEVKQHGLEPDVLEVKNYDAVEVFKAMSEKDEHGNNKQSHVLIGDNIYSTINLQSVKVL